MPDIQSPLWTFAANFITIITGIIGTVSIIASIIAFFKQRTPKGIAYEIVSSNPILNINEEVKGKIQVLFNGKPVENIHLVILRIMNYGNLPIPSKDFEIPLQMSFGSVAEILQAEILQTTPISLKNTVNLSIQQEKIVINPLLLNSQDTIDIKVTLSNFTHEINAQTRIEGIKEII
jgi:hypothetical protein